MSLGIHQKSDLDLESIRRFYSLGWPTEKQSTLAGLQTKKDLEKRHWIGLDLIQLDLIPPLREKSFFYQYIRYY